MILAQPLSLQYENTSLFVLVSLQDGPQCSMPPSIYTFIEFLCPCNSVYLEQCCSHDAMSPLG